MNLIPTGTIGRSLFAVIAAGLFLLAGWNMLNLAPQTPTVQFLMTTAFGLAALAVSVAIPADKD